MAAADSILERTAGLAAQDHSDRVSLSFTIGVYVAINAIRDAYLLVDAPDCAHLKTQYVQGNHDWFSTLTSTTGVHRVANTDLHPYKMVLDRDESVESLLRQMAEFEGSGVVLVTSMPMASITGLDYARLTRKVKGEVGKPVVAIPGNGLSGDWLDGYATTLEMLARAVSLEGKSPKPGNVAVVGYLMDRNEGDHRGNLREMQRLLAELGLDLGSVWLSGGCMADLERVREASAIVSLPYARVAARILGERLGVPVVETGLPLGLGGTERWLRQVAETLGGGASADNVVEAELARAAPRVQWVIPYQLLHRSVVFVGDPHLGLALHEMATEVGLRVEQHVVLNRKAHAQELLARCGAEMVLVDPKRVELASVLGSLAAAGRCDLLVGSSGGVSPGASQGATVEIGFPSFFTHVLEDRPFLFARGFVAVVERMVNELRRAELVSFTPQSR
jgi:nitrogenase molybdenum-iron protein alpha/beta subunit